MPGFRFKCHPETKTIFCVHLRSGSAHQLFNKWGGDEMSARIIVDVFISGWKLRRQYAEE